MFAFIWGVRARRLVALVGAFAATVVLCGAPPAQAAGGPASRQSVRLVIDFCNAQVVSGIIPGPGILVIRGVKPYWNMRIELVPRTYIRQPDYWGIEVTGTLTGVGLAPPAPYVVSIPLDGITGTRGIEVIGAHRSQLINIP